MQHKKPPFTITNDMIHTVASIAELVGRVSVSHQSHSPTLRRKNRIRSIHGSLAIEQNTLSVAQITAVLNGKTVLAPPKDIAEVKNAFEIYEHLDTLDPYAVDDLLMAHGLMMKGLLAQAGAFRSGSVGVVNHVGEVIHMGTLPDYVPSLIFELLDWARETDIHPLIVSCVFHYEFELIHPFDDGNGRMGRLWHTLLLSRWNSIFAWLPVESMIYQNQQAYYDAINQSNGMGESTPFIHFMLDVIQASLTSANAMSDEMTDEMTDEKTKQVDAQRATDDVLLPRKATIVRFLQTHDFIQNKDIQLLCNISAATASRTLRAFVADGTLVRVRHQKVWVYRLAKA